jgi:hypothetical protein
MFDICIIGSGPSAVISAKSFIDKGYKVCLIDSEEDSLQLEVPNKHFFEHLSPESDFLYPPDDTSFNAESGGAQLTKARSHLIRNVDKYFTVSSDNFSPFQTLASGGLSAAWGAACFTYSDRDLKLASLSNLQPHYEEVAKIIGISGPTPSYFCDINNKQPPAQIDHNGKSILKRSTHGLTLEQSSLAMLTESLGNRHVNPYFDMDFYSNFGDSIFRSIQILRNLNLKQNFTRIKGSLAISFNENEIENQVQVNYYDLENKTTYTVNASKLIICGGALNSYRFVANSLNCFNQENPILCNPYLYIPTLHLPSLGKNGSYLRHSLSQVFAEIDQQNSPTLQFYSYRSLLISRLMAQTPMPPFFARLFWRSLVEALVIVGAHFADDGTSKRSIKAQQNNGKLPTLTIDFPFPKIAGITGIITKLLKLKCVPMRVLKTKMGASIHYAGNMPISQTKQYPIGMDENGLIHSTKNVYYFDSSGWTYLPARGLTFTIMANAHRLAHKLQKSMLQ